MSELESMLRRVLDGY